LICCQDGICVLPQGLIEDAPKFPHRGVFLDVANSPLSMANLKRIVTLMASYKMNLLHLRLNGRTNFPVEMSDTRGRIESSRNRTRIFYGIEDIENLVEFSTRQGVRIIPELNIPGHAEAWSQIPSLRHLVSCPLRRSVLDPFQNETYEFMTQLGREVASKFPSRLFHSGADDIDERCWLPYKIAPEPVFHRLVDEQVRVLRAEGKSVILWENKLVHKHPNSMLPVKVQVWRSKNVSQLLANGYDLIISNHENLFVDCGSVGTKSRVCPRGKSWRTVYSNPLLEGRNAFLGMKGRIRGGELVFWMTDTDNGSALVDLAPNLIAAAELFWGKNSPDQVNSRFEFQRRLVSKQLATYLRT